MVLKEQVARKPKVEVKYSVSRFNVLINPPRKNPRKHSPFAILVRRYTAFAFESFEAGNVSLIDGAADINLLQERPRQVWKDEYHLLDLVRRNQGSQECDWVAM